MGFLTNIWVDFNIGWRFSVLNIDFTLVANTVYNFSLNGEKYRYAKLRLKYRNKCFQPEFVVTQFELYNNKDL